MPVVPDLYIAPGHINAFTAGTEKPLIVVHSGAIDSLTDDELLFVIAHELGHVKSGHVLYYQIAQFVLPVIAVQSPCLVAYAVVAEYDVDDLRNGLVLEDAAIAGAGQQP